MNRLKSILGYVWAILAIPIVLATFIGMDFWARGLAKATAVKISPWYTGGEVTRTRTHSEATAQEIDKEIHDILTACYQRARDLIEKHKDACERIAQALLKREVLSAIELEKLFKGEELPPNDTNSNNKKQVAPKPEPADKDKQKDESTGAQA